MTRSNRKGDVPKSSNYLAELPLPDVIDDPLNDDPLSDARMQHNFELWRRGERSLSSIRDELIRDYGPPVDSEIPTRGRFPATRRFQFPTRYQKYNPIKRTICKARYVRQQVLFALRVAGVGRRRSPGSGAGSYRHDWKSRIKC